MGTVSDIGWSRPFTARNCTGRPRARGRSAEKPSLAPYFSHPVTGIGRPWVSRRRSRLTRRKNEEVLAPLLGLRGGRQSVTLTTLS